MSNIEVLEIEMYKYFLKDYAEERLIRSPKGNRKAYICPFPKCGSGTGHNQTGALSIKNNFFMCFSCSNGGDIYKLVGIVENLPNFKDQFDFVKSRYENRITEIANDQIKMKAIQERVKENNTHSYDAQKQRMSNETLDPNKILAEYENNARKQKNEGSQAYLKKLQYELYENAKAMDYLYARGLNESTISKAQIGYDVDANMLVFPYQPFNEHSYYQYRSIEEKRYIKPLTEQLGTEPIYNEKALYEDKYCFICEGVLDALSIFQASNYEVNAIALGGTNGIGKLEKAFIYAKATNQPIKAKFISCMDRDEPGRKATNDILELFKKYNVEVSKVRFRYNHYENTKDANELLLSNAEQLQKDVLKACMQRKKASYRNTYDIARYVADGLFKSDIDYFKEYKDRKTGFSNIDEYFTCYPGMMVLGGGASVGKTTLAVNLALNLVEQGETVLYYSLEQEPNELISKVFARKLYEKTKNEAFKNYDLSNIEIKIGKSNPLLEQVVDEYLEKYEDNFIIRREDFSFTAKQIKEEVEHFIEYSGIIPIVIVDYLQLLSIPDDKDIRLGLDENIKVLKSLQRDNELFMMLISNFNRDGYINTVSYKSFKESGCIEYTADYMWGLQLTKTKTIKGTDHEKNIELQKEQSKLERSVELISLKNRQGRQSWNVFFKYHVAHDYLEVDTNTEYEQLATDQKHEKAVNDVKRKFKK